MKSNDYTLRISIHSNLLWKINHPWDKNSPLKTLLSQVNRWISKLAEKSASIHENGWRMNTGLVEKLYSTNPVFILQPWITPLGSISTTKFMGIYKPGQRKAVQGSVNRQANEQCGENCVVGTNIQKCWQPNLLAPLPFKSRTRIWMAVSTRIRSFERRRRSSFVSNGNVDGAVESYALEGWIEIFLEGKIQGANRYISCKDRNFSHSSKVKGNEIKRITCISVVFVFEYLLGWKKSNEKTHDSWINSYFSASERSISMRFSTFSSSILLNSQYYIGFVIPTIKIRIEIFEFKKFHFSKWLNPQLNMFVLRKGTVRIGQKCVDSPSKRLICISFIEIQVQIGQPLETSEAGTLCRSKMR